MSTLVQSLGYRNWSTGVARILGDRVVQALVVGFVIVAVLDPSQAVPSLRFTGEALAGMAPFFLLAIALAAFAKASGADGLIARAFSGNPVSTIVAASLVGAFSPFCSCGVIPLIAGMLGAGVPLAPVMAFWISSPIMDPEMFVLTAAGIGLGFTVAKTAATIVMGLLAGFSVLALQRLGWLLEPLPARARGGCRKRFDPNAPIDIAWRFWREPARRAAFRDEVRHTGGFLGKWLAIAFFLESLMIAYVPSAWVAQTVGGDSAFAIPLAAAVGVPSYLNGYAAIPLVAGLLDMGMTPGAAMTFVTSGAVSSIPAAVAVYALVRKPVFAAYVLLGLGGSILAGYAYALSGAGI